MQRSLLRWTVLLLAAGIGLALIVRLGFRSRTGFLTPSPPSAEQGFPPPEEPPRLSDAEESLSEEEVPPWRRANLARVAQLLQQDQEAARRNPDLFVRRGLIANRKTRQVRVYAEAIALDPRAELEFFIIPEQSGHDYEALAVSFAQPSAIHEALEFIGLPRGRPISGRQHCYWPKGERVHIVFEWTPPSIAGEPTAPLVVHAEELLYDTVLRQTLPVRGFVFTGSRTVPHPQNPTQSVYAADLFGPNSIASAYNDPETVLDVPHQAGKSAMYGRQFANPQYRFEKGQFFTILLEPECPPDRLRVRDLTLRLVPSATPHMPPTLSFESPLGHPLLSAAQPVEATTFLETLAAEGQDAFVLFQPDPRATLETVRLVCAWLDLMEQSNLLRVEPPPTGYPYYRAFLPEERLRDRRNWIVKPRELRLIPTTDPSASPRAILTLITEQWEENREEPTLVLSEEPIASPESLAQRLAELPRETSVLLIFAPETMPLATLLPFAQAAETTHPILWFFPEPSAGVPSS